MNAPAKKAWVSEPVAALALLGLSIACAAFLFVQPRPVAPRELPCLTLPAELVEAAIAADTRAAAAAPDTPQTRALQALMAAQGEAEDRGFETGELTEQRRQALRDAFAMLVAELGEPAVLRLRAKAALALEDALELRLPVTERKRVIGGFTDALALDGVTRNGYRVAAPFVIRTLYKARWNVLCGLSPAHAFARIEQRAYFGYQALHAERLSLTRRIEALYPYGLAGGQDVQEALGVLLFRAEEYEDAARALQAAYRERGSLRLRNYTLAVREILDSDTDIPRKVGAH